MRKIAKPLSIIILVVGIMAMSGCGGLSAEERTEIALKSRYNEEFVVHTIDATSWGGGRFAAYVSPVNNPDVVFETMMNDQGWDGDNYAECYTAALINDILKEDLEDFFPGAYIRTEVENLSQKEEILNFSDKSLEDMIVNSQGIGSVCVDIYYDKEIGTNKEYEKEFIYFTDGIAEYIEKKQMFPITVAVIKVDNVTIDKLKKYFCSNLKENGDFDRDILGVDFFTLCNLKNDGSGSDLGKPYNIYACFDEKYVCISSKEEYIRRRELLENAE